ncbi:hypothetical protein RZS08_40325, partial [Arthrospira platensis SPKY1]|nr:hypothetical protein [Arthrospira platensis SPKY1]
MRDLLLLLLRFGGFLLFLILEVLSFFLVIQFNQDQRAIFDNSWANLSAGADRTVNKVERYASLGRTNDSLAAVNARYLAEIYYYRELLKNLEEDTLQVPL